jgi:small-conductance mechanosensitive channel
MEFSDFNDLITTLGAHFAEINLPQKLESVVITLIILFIALKVNDFILGRVFNEKRVGLYPIDIKRLVTLKQVVRPFTRDALYLITILVILSYFIDVGAILAVAGVGTIAIGFGARAVVEDMLAGFLIVFENHFGVGDYVTLDDKRYGKVENIGVRTTTIRLLDNSLYIIHNGQIDKIINHSKGTVKATVDVSVAYEENIEAVLKVLNGICEELYHDDNGLFPVCPEVLGVTRMDPSGMNIRITADEDATRRLDAETLLRRRIKEVFDAKGIEIPYDKTVVIMDQEAMGEKKEDAENGQA